MRTYITQFKGLYSFFGGDRFQSLICALILPAIFFSSPLFGPNPQFNFFGDLYNLYFPQFVEGYHLAKNSTFSGIDFLTNNGASAYFLRPNIPAYYPAFQLVYLVFSFDTIEGLARALMVILYAHSVLALYFSVRIGRKYFQMDRSTSLLLGVLFFGAAAYQYNIIPFYFATTLFPLMLYFALKSIKESSWWRLALYSFPFVMVLLSGYLPLDINAVLLAFLFVLVYFWADDSGNKQPLAMKLARLMVPVGLACVVVLPLYLAILKYNKLMPGLPVGVYYSAYELYYQSKDIFALISKGFIASAEGSESPSVILGMAPVLLLLIAFTHRKRLTLTSLEARVVAASIIIFSFYLLLVFGQASGLPHLFYYLVPGLGKMHIYGRFLPTATFFLYLSVAIVFKHLVEIRAELPIGRWLAGLGLALITVHVYGQIGQPPASMQTQLSVSELIRNQVLVIELLMLGLMLISLSARASVYAYVGAIAVSFLIHAHNFHSYTSSFNNIAQPPYQNTVIFSEQRRGELRNYFKQHSSNKLIKYADLTSSIDKPNGVLANYPWVVQDTVLLSNYVGYELHLSIDRDYADLFWFGKTSVPWLLRTEADFVIYDQTAWSIFAKELEPFINHEVPEFDIGYGYKAAKLKDASGLVDYIPVRKFGDFDNGIVRVYNAAGTAAVSGFETDLASYVRFEVDESVRSFVCEAYHVV